MDVLHALTTDRMREEGHFTTNITLWRPARANLAFPWQTIIVITCAGPSSPGIAEATAGRRKRWRAGFTRVNDCTESESG